MKNYDNYFLPVDNMEEAKRYYEEILGLKKKFDFSDKGMVAYNIGTGNAVEFEDPFGNRLGVTDYIK